MEINPTRLKNKLKLLALMLEAGPMNVTSYLVWKLLVDGKLERARKEYEYDGDKVPSELRPFIEDIVGCRVHGNINCNEGFCGRKK